jgi:hypothetical protein
MQLVIECLDSDSLSDDLIGIIKYNDRIFTIRYRTIIIESRKST